MNGFLAAVQFLTVIPLRVRHFLAQDAAEALIYFPVVGILLGLCGKGLLQILSAAGLADLSACIIVVVAMAAVTGGLHLDGLADTSDALAFAAKNGGDGGDREKMLEIMRDSRTGALGVVALICDFLLKIALLYSLDTASRCAAIMIMPVAGRWPMVLSLSWFPYARSVGKAGLFKEGVGKKHVWAATAIALILAFVVWRSRGVFLVCIAAGAAYAFGGMMRRKIGGITGDTLGAVCEINEVLFLACAVILNRVL